MSEYLLDTNIASFLIKETSPALLYRVARQPPSSLAICTITQAELLYGMERMPSEARIWKLVPKFLSQIPIQPRDSPSATRYAALYAAQQRLGKSLSILDTMIAAHALAHGCILITNDKAFTRIQGLTVEDWTKGPQRA